MAQLRLDFPKFKELNTGIMVVVPNGPKTIENYIEKYNSPYSILSDKGAMVTEQYCVEIKRARLLKFTLFKPGVFLVDKLGTIRYTNYLTSYVAEPDNQIPLALLAQTVN
jgi:peroxiredoxin